MLKFKLMKRAAIVILIFSLSGFSSLNLASAYVASSSNYRIQSDSVNFSGGLGTSSNYRMESTLGEIATDNSSSTNYAIKAGYQQMITSAISISAPSNADLGSLNGITGGTANTSVSWTVTTDNSAGYSLTIQAGSSPALTSGSNNIPNYTPSGSNPDFTWSINATDSEFGFSPEGADTVQRYLDNGSTCNNGSGNTSDTCWDPLGTSATTIAQSGGANSPGGTATTLKLRVEIGAGEVPVAGSYSTTITAIATAL